MTEVKVKIPSEVMTIFGNAESLAIRLVVLTNGTAAVAILAFLGTIWASEAGKIITDLAWSLKLLIGGASCGCLASLLNYFACHKASMQPYPDIFNTIEEFEKWITVRQKLQRGFTYLIMVLLVIGFVCFLWGVGRIYGVFESLISELPANIPVTP